MYPHFAVYRRCLCEVNFVVLRSCCAFTRRALCAPCSVGSAGSLAMFFLCISSNSSILLGSWEAEGQSVDTHFTYEVSFLSPRSTLNLTASGLNFKIAVKSTLALSIARTVWSHLLLRTSFQDCILGVFQLLPQLWLLHSWKITGSEDQWVFLVWCLWLKMNCQGASHLKGREYFGLILLFPQAFFFPKISQQKYT